MRCLLLTLAVANVCSLAAQDRPALGRTGADWFPLGTGAKWTYARTDQTGARSEILVTCRGEAKAGRTEAFELGTRTEESGSYEYWRVDDAGVWRHAGLGDGVMPGLTAEAGARWLACPIGLETSWSWKQRLEPALTRLVGNEFDARELAPYRAELRDLGAEVVVPAGTFRAACVQIDVQPDPGGAGQRVLIWFASGVGPVKRETYNLDANAAVLIERDELKAFTPAPAATAGPLQLAQAFVQAHADLWSQPPELELLAFAPGNVAVVNRFVRARAETGPRLLRVAEGVVVPFDLEVGADVQAYFEAESVTAAANRLPQHMEMNQFSRLYFALRASLDGPGVPVPTMRSSRSSSSGGPDGMVRSGTFTASNGDELEMVFRNGKLEKIAFKRKEK